MRILLATIGTAGDVHPFVGLGRALRERGHCVTLLTNPHFAPVALAAGLEFGALGTEAEYLAATTNPDFFTDSLKSLRLLVKQLVAPALRPLYETIATAYMPGDTVVAASSLAFGARIAQERLGVPLATVHLQPTLLRTACDIPVFPSWVPRALKQAALPLVDAISDRLFAGPVNATQDELGLKPARAILGRWLHSPQRILGLFPEWYAPPQPDWPPRTCLTGFPLYDARGPEADPAVVDFLEAGEPPLVFTPGTAMMHAASFFEASVEACERIGRRGLLLTRHRGQVPADLPPRVRHFDYVPFSQVLPRAAALIHHGGIGTTAQGLAAGIPQLLVPQGFDQPDSAARLRRMGVGDSLKPADYRAAAVAQKLDRLLSDPEVAARCASLAARIRVADPVPETCRLIESLGETGRTRGAEG